METTPFADVVEIAEIECHGVVFIGFWQRSRPSIDQLLGALAKIQCARR